MSQCLVLFRESGIVEYQYNPKVTPFNEYIALLVNETVVALSKDFSTAKINQKRFYSYKRDDLYAALYFDVVHTIDSEKIKSTLADSIKTFNKVLSQGSDQSSKASKMIDYQFNQLMQLKLEPAVETLVSVVQSSAEVVTNKARGKANKMMRKWDGETVVDGDGSALDYSEVSTGAGAAGDASALADSSRFVRQDDIVLVEELRDILDESDSDFEEDDPAPKTGFLSKLGALLGGTINLDEVSKKFFDQLVAKNIAASTAKDITNKLQQNLSNKKNVTLKVYKQALNDELTKILTPNVLTDLLYDIKLNKEKGSRPYVISVVGVNGVGKSTNLAKLAYWLLQNDMSVLICACDTFRSGAVEQLKVHVSNLKTLSTDLNSSKIELFEKGYGSGDHVVVTAKLAIQHATNAHFDVVLIDTAGRTHSNTKLMAPLKKFGDAANPNKIIMVGEALVGTDSVEQAINFNSAFGNKRSLDFFIISKVDTVGDLVGAMINMVMATKVPILLLGTGQTYTDIKRLSVKTVVNMLMS